MKKAFFALWICLLVGCSNLQGGPTIVPSPVPGSVTATASLTPTLTATLTPSPTGTPNPYLDFGEIEPGQYILIENNRSAGNLYIYSTNNEVIRRFSLEAFEDIDADFGTFFGTSRDGQELLVMRPGPKPSLLYNFTDEKWSDLLIAQECLQAAWSPDKRYIALACVDTGMGELSVLDTVSGSLVQITNCLESESSCSSPAWSPDGRWLAYFWNVEKSGIQPQGIRLLSTDCLKDNQCISTKTELLEADSNPAWTPENELILSNHGAISILKEKKGQFSGQQIIDTGNDTRMQISVSPDGEYILYQAGFNELTLYSRTDQTSTIFFESTASIEPIGWIVIK